MALIENGRLVGKMPATNTQTNNKTDYTLIQILNDNFRNIHFINDSEDFPDNVNGVISLLDNHTYFITSTVDLNGNRLVCGENTTLMGSSSESCRIKSTGLTGQALLTSNFSLPIKNLTIEADVALDLQGDGTTTALDWFGVNFTNCTTIGTIVDYANYIMTDCAFLDSGGLTFDGTLGTISFIQCLFNPSSGDTMLIFPSTLTISRRFRCVYSSFV